MRLFAATKLAFGQTVAEMTNLIFMRGRQHAGGRGGSALPPPASVVEIAQKRYCEKLKPQLYQEWVPRASEPFVAGEAQVLGMRLRFWVER